MLTEKSLCVTDGDERAKGSGQSNVHEGHLDRGRNTGLGSFAIQTVNSPLRKTKTGFLRVGTDWGASFQR